MIFDTVHKSFDDRIERLLVEITYVGDPSVVGSAFIFRLIQ